MKNLLSCLLIGVCIFNFSCHKQDTASKSTTISSSTLQKISSLGFSNKNVRKVKDGYLVEHDILLTDKLLNGDPRQKLLRVAKSEQYRTTNTVSGLPRTITIMVTNLGQAFIDGADLAISRYNALGLSLQFQRVTSGSADITISGFYQGPDPDGFITLGYSGFPTDTGDPYNTVMMNTHPDAYGSNPDVLYVGSVIQHEVGHCIGMRHTDYMDRSYSCGGDPVNEGASDIGAINIPGTPTGPDANSWMLACSNGGDRTFNANDVTALSYLYQ